jgi:hypothetical protein
MKFRLAILIPAFLVGNALANSGIFGGGSDCDEATIQGVLSLLRLENPYAQTTYLGNPITPLPGALLLSVPMLHAANILWLCLCPLIVLLNPRVWHCLAIGSDYPANTIYVCMAVLFYLRRRSMWSAAILGVTLSSRLNFLFVLPFAWGKRAWIAVVVFLVLSVPALPYMSHTAKIHPAYVAAAIPLALWLRGRVEPMLGISLVQMFLSWPSNSQLYSVFWWIPLCFYLEGQHGKAMWDLQ